MSVKNSSPQEVLQVVAAAGGPRQVAGVSSFHPFTRHDVRVTGAGGVVVIVAHSHAEDKIRTHRHCLRVVELVLKIR